MLIILLAAFIASRKFAATAAQKGCDRRQAAGYPWRSGLICLLIGFVLSILFGAIFQGMPSFPNFAGLFSWVWNLFVLCVYFAVLSKAWKSLKALPDRK